MNETAIFTGNTTTDKLNDTSISMNQGTNSQEGPKKHNALLRALIKPFKKNKTKKEKQ